MKVSRVEILEREAEEEVERSKQCRDPKNKAWRLRNAARLFARATELKGNKPCITSSIRYTCGS